MPSHPTRGIAVAALIALSFFTAFAVPARAIDTISPKDIPDLAPIRAEIKAGRYAVALKSLDGLVERGIESADVYNLIGFARRKSGDRGTAEIFYRKALDYDPNHKGALEYQGELFIETGRPDRARANLAKLVTLCPSGCEEREDLEKALASVAAAQ